MNNKFEKSYLKNQEAILFCDEVGRGPIAGPVVSCTVIYKSAVKTFKINKKLIDLGINDSKKISSKKRKEIVQKLNIDINKLKKNTKYDCGEFSFIINQKSPLEIDKINILQASLAAMRDGTKELINQAKVKSALVLIDGNKTFSLEEISQLNKKKQQIEILSIVKGDAKSAGISLASVIAKEFRDHLMLKYDKKYPGYGLANHAGYPTVMHKQAVKDLGVTPIHRKSFKGVKEYL